jgi:hypothetical protein
MAQVVDLRGRKVGSDRPPVLLDPSGGRARVLAWGGRAVAFLFLLWLIGLVFAGLGLLPSGAIPLGRALVGPAPPVLKTLPRLTQPNLVGPGPGGRSGTAAALRGAGSSTAAGGPGAASTGQGTGGARSGAGASPGSGHGTHNGTGTASGTSSSGSTSSGSTGTSSSTSATHPDNGRHAAGTRPGQTRSQATPGHTKSSTSSSSGSTSSNGHQTTGTTTTTQGKSGSAPGHAAIVGRGNST